MSIWSRLRDFITFNQQPAARPHIDNWASLLAKICPDCKHYPVVLYEGPSGGMSTNVFCGNCGHGYNITPMMQRAEDIGINLNYCKNEQIKARRALENKFAGK